MIRGFILHLRGTLLSLGVFHIIKISFRLPVRSHHFILAYFYISAGHTAKGEEYLNKALSIFPEYADANFMMAQMQVLRKNYVSAKEYNDKCLSIDPNHKDALDLRERLKNKLDNPASDK